MTKKERIRRNHTKHKGGKKRRIESPYTRNLFWCKMVGAYNRAYRQSVSREIFKREFSLKAIKEGKPICVISKLLRKALWLREGTVPA